MFYVLKSLLQLRTGRKSIIVFSQYYSCSGESHISFLFLLPKTYNERTVMVNYLWSCEHKPSNKESLFLKAFLSPLLKIYCVTFLGVCLILIFSKDKLSVIYYSNVVVFEKKLELKYLRTRYANILLYNCFTWYSSLSVSSLSNIDFCQTLQWFLPQFEFCN